MEDILALDDGLEDEDAFHAVAAVSRLNDKLYLSFFSPLIRSMMDETTAETIRQLHPLRSQRYIFAGSNPVMWPVKYWADWIRKNRLPVTGDNMFLEWERKWSDSITSSLDYFRDSRDLYLESTFKLLYENPWMKTLFPNQEKFAAPQTEAADQIEGEIRNEMWLKTAEQGGFEAAVVRIILAVSAADASIDQREYLAAYDAIVACDRLGKLDRTEIKRLVKQQAAIIDHDKERALKALPRLLSRKASRQKAFEIANSVAQADFEIDQQEQEILEQIKSILKL
jgi:tellurite resistance protein